MSILSERDINAQIGAIDAQTSDANSKGFKPEQSLHRQTIMNKDGSNESGAYISPSDAIMSPASKKLANFKQRQINKQINPTRRTLFARTVSSTSSGLAEEQAEIYGRQQE